MRRWVIATKFAAQATVRSCGGDEVVYPAHPVMVWAASPPEKQAERRGHGQHQDPHGGSVPQRRPRGREKRPLVPLAWTAWRSYAADRARIWPMSGRPFWLERFALGAMS